MTALNKLIHRDPNLSPWIQNLIRYRYLFFLLATMGVWADKQLFTESYLVPLYSVIMVYLGLVFRPYWILILQSFLVTISRYYLPPAEVEGGLESIAELIIQWFSYYMIGFAVSTLVKKNLEHIHHQAKIRQLAYYDSLTGLPNRNLLNEVLENKIVKCGRTKRQLAVMYFDIDRFKFINDTMGHDLGDELLIQVSQRVKHHLPEDGFCARQGGDEFFIIKEFSDEIEIKRLSETILNTFSAPFNLNGEAVFTTASMGISLYPKDGTCDNELQKCAEKAMYLAKERGRNHIQYYKAEPEDIMLRKVRLETALRQAIDRNELTLYYQPQVDFTSDEVTGVEALIRWNHPELGNISPEEFIPLAEETDLIVEIGKWVMYEACSQYKNWSEFGENHLNLSVNVSAQQFKDEGFIEMVKHVLTETQVDPEWLHLEITESVMQNYDASSFIIETLKELGVKVSIDDFGTGFSSLSVLKHLNIDAIKIDKSFTSDILYNAGAASIVSTIIDMSLNLGLKVIAEGVETKQQAEFLKKERCTTGQGYLYSKPLPQYQLLQKFIDNKGELLQLIT